MTTTAAPPRARSVGASFPHRGAESAVTGALEYLTDLRFPDALFAAVVRSTVPHGRIRAIDVAPARGLPGVVAVLTAADVPDNRCGQIVADQPVLAGDVVRHVGEPIALVVAGSARVAARAAALVAVDIAPLPVVADARAALAPGAPLLHPGGNRVAALEHERGDVEAGLAGADLVVDRIVHTPCQEHVCLEPGGGAAVYADGRLTVWIGSQNPGSQAREIARSLGLEPGDVRLVSTPMGGAFGSKTDGPPAIHLALAAMATGRPVRLVLTRDEVMVAGVKRHAFTVRTRLGMSRDGTLAALDTEALVDTGPYASVGAVVLKVAAEMSTGPYRIPAARFSGQVAYTNNAVAGAFRGYGVPQVAFALETALDDAARRLGLDPLEVRRRNLLAPGDPHALYGHRVGDGLRVREALDAVAAHPWWTGREEWERKDAAPWRRGTGLAVAMKGVGKGSGWDDVAGARLHLDRSGAVTIWAGPNHSGQFIETAYAQIAADALGRPYEDIAVVVGDTGLVPESGSCAASRSTYAGGSAVRVACDELLDRVRALALAEPIDWAEAGRRLGDRGEALVEATFRLPGIEDGGSLDLEKFGPHLVYGSAAHLVRLAVHERTGQVVVHGVVCAVDCGTAINPAGVVGQTAGGVVQGLGFALMEDYRVDEGVPRTTSLETYLIPTIRDAPPVETILVEAPEETGPFGAKGMAEVVVVPAAPAVAAALAAAIGIDLRRLPATPERVARLAAGMEET